MDEENQFPIEENQFPIEQNQNISDESPSTITETEEVPENAAPEEKDVNAQMEDYLRQVSAGVIPKSSNPDPQAARDEQQLALRDQLHTALQQITNTEVDLDTSAEEVLLADLQVYDKKKDRFVMLKELSDPPEYLTADSKISFDLVSKMLMDEHSFFLPKWDDEGKMDMNDPIMIGGGFVNGNYYLQVNDTAKANENARVQAPLQKPGFFDRFVDLFRRLFNRGRDPICEVWDRYEPFRKADHDRMKIKKSKPLRMAKSMEDEIKAAEADLENNDLSEEEKEKQKAAFKKQVAMEQKLGDASENVLSGEGRKVLEDIHKQIKAHMKNLCEQGDPGKDMDEKWGMLPNVRGTADSDVPAYALFGMAIAFSILGKRQETLNQMQYRSLVTGNYDAIGGREGHYKEVIEKLEEVMRNSHRNKHYGFAELDDARNWAAADKEAEIIGDRISVVSDGLQRMEQELLGQPDPASPWSLELGRMLECAEAMTIKKEGTYHARERLVTFYMSPNAKGLCVKQHDVEKGIGHEPESPEYLAAQAAVNELWGAAVNGDYEAFAPVDLEMKTRLILDEEKQWDAEKNAINKPFENFAEEFTYESVGTYDYLLEKRLFDGNGTEYGGLQANQVYLIAAAYSQADKYQLNGEDIRQFITGQPIRGDEDLTNRFKEDVQEVLDCRDKEANQATYTRAFDKIEAELYEMKDFTSGWSYILCNALEGCSFKARMSPTSYQIMGGVFLKRKNPVVSERDEENFLLEELIDYSHNFQTPDSVLSGYNKTKPEEKKHFESYLKGAVRKELASSFLAQLANTKGADQRLSFLRSQGTNIKALMDTADTYIHENLDKYLVSDEAFKAAGFGGALKDVKNMVFGMKAKAAPKKAAAKQNPKLEAPAANKGRAMS